MQLLRLMLATCTHSHDKTYMERKSSLNKYLLAIHGGSTSEKVIEAILFVKDYVILNGGKNNVPITRAQLKKLTQSRQKWKEDLKAQRELKQKEYGAKREMQPEKSKENKLNENKKRINEGTETIKARIEIADDLLKSWQSELEEVTKMKAAKKVKLLDAHFQIVTGMKQKRKLEEKLDFPNRKLQKLN